MAHQVLRGHLEAHLNSSSRAARSQGLSPAALEAVAHMQPLLCRPGGQVFSLKPPLPFQGLPLGVWAPGSLSIAAEKSCLA